MSQDHINRGVVRDRLARLDETYGVDYREDKTVEVEPERFPREVEMSRNGYDGSSYVWVVRTPEDAAPLTPSMPEDAGNDRDRVLLILGRGGDRWGVPGGGREGDEILEEGARREVHEETSVECSVTDLFGVWRERRTAPGFDEVLHNLRAVFVGRYEDGHIQVQPGELDGAAWHAKRPRRLGRFASPIADGWFEAGE